MHLDTAVAKRYAKALWRTLAGGAGEETPERAARILEQLATAAREHEQLRRLLANPAVDVGRKAAVLDAIAERLGAGPVLRRFVRLVAERERAGRLEAIAAAFRARVDEAAGIVNAEVCAPRPLGPEEVRALERSLAATTGRKVRLRTSTEPELLGGLVTRIGDVIYDGSLRHQLARLRERMAGG